MKPGDKVKVKDDTGAQIEGVICKKVQEKTSLPRFIVYSFSPGQVWDNPEKQSNMLIAPANWIWVEKIDAYEVFKKPEVGPYEFGVKEK